MKHALWSFAILFIAVQICTADDATVKARLDSCITYYQNGEYQKAVDSIKSLIPLISNKRDEAEAYKYIGFSYCMLDMINKAKDFFKVALEKFPQLMIDTLEVPPNITIVFKQTKLETQMEKGELVEKPAPDNRPILITFLSSTGVVSGMVGVYFLYRGHLSRQTYRSLDSDASSDLFDVYWKRQRNQTIAGGAAIGFAFANAATAVYLKTRKPDVKKNRASLDVRGNSVSLCVSF